MGSKTHYRSCTLCEAMCGIKIQTKGEKIISIKGDGDDPFSRGYICPKASALAEIHEDPDRLRQPIIREGDGWREASWEEAINKAADIVHGIQRDYGDNALGIYLGNPNVHNFGAIYYLPRFLRTLRTRNRFSATSLDQLPHMFAAYHMFGHQLMLPVPDIDRCDYMIVMGGNPLASNGSIMTAPDIRNRLKAIKKRGSLVVLDPRLTETAEFASEHHFIKPGTDAALLMAMIHVVFHELTPKLDHLQDHLLHLQTVKDISEKWMPERAANLTGIHADTIRNMARQLLETERAVCYGRIGTSTQRFGGLCNWLLNVLNIICGNFDREGGMMFTSPAVDLLNAPSGIGASRGHWNRWKSRVRGRPEFDGEFPAAVMAEEIEQGGEGQIRGLITVAGNPVLSAPNGRKLDTALVKLQGQIAIDCYINETTRHADVILPPVSPLERSHYDLVFHLLAVRNTAKFSPPLFKKPAGSKEDWEIMQALCEKVLRRRGKESLRNRLAFVAEKHLTPERFLSGYLLSMSPYRPLKGEHKQSLTLGKLKAHPHGIDLGPLQSRLPGALHSKDKKIDLAPDCFMEDIERLGLHLPQSNGQLLLIGRRHIRSNNSWMHNSKKLQKGKSLCTLFIHPDDAEKLALQDGTEARVQSRVGEIQIPVEITEKIMPGVVSIPHGYGHNREHIQLQQASKKPGVSINDLTDDERLDALTGNAALSGTPVEVQPV